MSKFTNYIAEVQDLSIVQAAVYNALSDRTLEDTSICWPTRADISNITKIKKLDTITKAATYLEEQAHIIRVGPVIKNNQTKTNLYWVNNGVNDIRADLLGFVKTLDSGFGSVFLAAEMKTTIEGFLESYPQGRPLSKGGTPFRGGGVSPSGGEGYPPQTGNGKPIENLEKEIKKENPKILVDNSNWNKHDPYIEAAKEIHRLEESYRERQELGCAYVPNVPVNGITSALRRYHPGVDRQRLKGLIDAYRVSLDGHRVYHGSPDEFVGYSNFAGCMDWLKNTATATKNYNSAQDWEKLRKPKQAQRQQGYVTAAVYSAAHKDWTAESDYEEEAIREANRMRVAREEAEKRSLKNGGNTISGQSRSNRGPRSLGELFEGGAIA